LTFAFRALKTPDGIDETAPSDYTADSGEPGVEPDLPVAATT
ncbi:MAG: solute:Na+ symporter, family, partial [Streptomyces sp.]|nr:solute:Na+ symporter, family [Streptomyces sp.]